MSGWRIEIATPAPPGSLVGNRSTAERYASILRALGHDAEVVETWSGAACDALVALHATKSHASVRAFSEARPRAPLVVVLTGTDIYRDLGRDPRTSDSLERASHVVVLQGEAVRELPPRWHAKTRVILQSVEARSREASPDPHVLQVCALAHLRPVKDPFLLADATHLLPSSSRVRAVHAGEALEPACAERAERESGTNPRWRWVGPLSSADASTLLSESRALVSTSIAEGGSRAIAEAVVEGKPVLATRIAGSVGMLGATHPGFFEARDSRALARLLARLDEDRSFEEALACASRGLAPRYAPAREMEAWRDLIDDAGFAPRSRFRVRAVARAAAGGSFADDVRRGLSSTPKRLACRFFYDEAGSRLFEEICALPEYYLTRAEDEILERHAAEIVASLPSPVGFVEFGSGSGEKTQRLLAAEIARSGRTRYVPIDISRSALETSARVLCTRLPTLELDGVEAEYEDGIAVLSHGAGPTLVLWLGSNIGNLDRRDAAAFLARVRVRLRPRDALLLGADLRKPAAIIEPAYDDSRGVTARFNKNLLSRINAELGGGFDLDAFRHVARYDEVEGRVDMYLESACDQVVPIRALDLVVPFARGERIHTESSFKHSIAELDDLAAAAGFAIAARWLDSRRWFAECLLVPRD